MPSASNSHAVEHILRTVTTEMGSRSGVSMAPLSRATCQKYGLSEINTADKRVPMLMLRLN